MIGSFEGDGGRFLCGFWVVYSHLRRRSVKENKGRRERKKGCNKENIFLFLYMSCNFKL